MDEIRRQDLQLWVRAMLRFERLIFLAPVAIFFSIGVSAGESVALVVSLACLIAFGWVSWNDSIKRRFRNPRFASRWLGCQDRLERFEQVLKKLKKEQFADLKEMPATIRQVAQSVYVALRKADMVAHEVQSSEIGLANAPAAWTSGTSDPQSQALYQVADRNVAEYRAELSAVLAGVHRAEAQSAVFMTTLDSLRMKMQGYRLVGRRPELPSQEFLESLAEARAQLQSIDSALEELDLGHYPTQISVVTRPPIPPEEVQRIERNR